MILYQLPSIFLHNHFKDKDVLKIFQIINKIPNNNTDFL
jgi:hypothetical protein